MSLPTVIIFERHWDTIPKYAMKELLPELNKRGYETICFEAPQNISSTEIRSLHNSGIKNDFNLQKQSEKLLKQVGITKKMSDMSFGMLSDVLKSYVSSKKYYEVAEKMKQLPASCILKEVFDEAEKLTMTLKGIDINNEEYSKLIAPDVTKRTPGIIRVEDFRIATMFHNLLKLREQQEEGVIFACGASHAKGLIDKFKKHGLQKEVLYYFPHSASRYEDSIDDVNDVTMNDTLKGHTHCLSQKDIPKFGKKIIREITKKTRYTGEILFYNSHSNFLSECFKTNFRPFLRPGHRVDALVDIAEPKVDVEDIQRRVTAVGVESHKTSFNGRTYLVIPNVNTTVIGERIRKISF